MAIEPDIRRMRAAAAAFLADAATLNQGFGGVSDGGYLLRLIAFEILLKTLIIAHGQAPLPSHKYAELWAQLPPTIQERVHARAADRMLSSADYANLSETLKVLGSNFVKLRYPYEAYSGKSDEEVTALGEAWVANDAPVADAVHRYYPEELFGLTFALDAQLHERAACESSE